MSLKNLILASTAIVGLAPQLALAQDTGDDATAQENAGLDVIIVTAQFREENSQAAAVPIAIVDTDQLNRQGVSSAAQLTTIVPALQIANGGAGSQAYYLRGVGNTTPTSLVDPGVAFNVDGVYIGRPTSVRNTFFDLERVEVLKGPQGTLYGRNSTGGAINVLPAKPRIGESGGYISGSYGNYDAFGIDGALNLDLSDTAAARIAFTRNKHDGYLSDGTSDEDGFAIRGQVLFEPSDTVVIRLGADFAHDGGNGAGSVISGYLNSFTLAPTDDPLPRDIGYLDDPSDEIFEGLHSFVAGRFGEGIDTVPYTDNDFWGVRGEVNVDSAIGVFTVISSYRESDLNSLDTGNGIPAQTEQTDNQFSFEARLASPEEGLIRYLLGAYYFDESAKTNYNFNVQALASFQDINISTESIAGFGRLTIAPTDTLRIVGGLRVTDEKKHFFGRNDVIRVVCDPIGFNTCPDAMFFSTPDRPFLDLMVEQMGLIDASGGTQTFFLPPDEDANYFYPNGITLLDRKIGETKVTWRAGIEYDAGPESLLYASVETGYHAGGFSFSSFVPEFGPETVTAYTLGSKNRFMGNTLQLNAELFYWIFKDQQVSHFADDGLGNLSFVTENAGKSTNYGAELSLLYKPATLTSLNAEIQYLNAEYDEFLYRLPSGPAAPPPITGCPFIPDPELDNQVLVDCSGRPALKSPEWTINLGAEQIVPLGANFELVGNVDFKYQSSAVIGFEMLPGINEEDGYTTTSIALTFQPVDMNWSITGYIRNLEDERPFGQTFFNNQFNLWASSPLPPRTYGVRARMNF